MSAGARPRMGYVVDMQNDFVLSAVPGGRLHVRHLADPADTSGAERIIPAVLRLATWMADECDLVVFTGDGHRADDPEISAAVPDFVNTYPQHCEAYSDDAATRAGAQLIDGLPRFTERRRVLRDADRGEAVQVARSAMAAREPVYVEKSVFDVWQGNPCMEAFMVTVVESLQQKPEIIAAGVAGDVCVRQGLEGFFARGYPVTVVTDAIYSLDGREHALFDQWAARGAVLTTVDELCARASRTEAQSRR